MQNINKLSKRYGFKIIEDASHAIGATYNDQKVGSCNYSDITIFSFHPVKIITTAEGGMLLTNSKKIYKLLTRLRAHGITREKEKFHLRPKNEIWNYQQIELGFNYRMNDIQGALGLSQLRHLDEFINSRTKIANYYDLKLKNLPIITPWQASNVLSSYHLYPILVDNSSNLNLQKKLYHKFLKKKIGVNIHYIPVHLHPYYKKLGFRRNDFPVSENFFRRALSIPIYPGLSKKTQNKIIKIISSTL